MNLAWLVLPLLGLLSVSLGAQAETPSSPCSDLLVATTAEILKGMSGSTAQQYRRNPKTVYKFKVGDEYYVTPGALGAYPGLKRKIKGPILMKVVQISRSSYLQKKTRWEVVYLESPETGRIAVESWRLMGDAFSVKDYAQYAPFEADEYVQVGSDYSNTNVFRHLVKPEETSTLSGKAAPYIGQFIRVYDDKHYVVQVRSTMDGVPPTQIIVPSHSVYGLPSGTAAHFEKSVKVLLSVPLTFKVNELVRYRDEMGMIKLGTFVEAHEGYFSIQDEFGNLVQVLPQSVFRYLTGEPHTPVYRADWIQAFTYNPSYLVRKFLDGAGKLSSLPDFAELSDKEKILTLMKYLKANVSWKKSAISCESAGLWDFNEILTAGAGVCRHLSVLMATMLGELGYTPRVAKYQEADKDGHAWVEVDVEMPNGALQTLVVDPSNGDFVKSFSEVSAAVAKDKKSFEASWYVQPEREFLVVQPQTSF